MRTNINSIVAKLPVDNQAQTRSTITAFLNAVGDELADGKTVSLHGFGTFSTKHNSGGVAFNKPYGPSKTVKFKVGDSLKAKVN